MKKKIPSNGVEIIKSDKRAVVFQGGIKILRKGKPIKGTLVKVGFVYLVVDCSTSMTGYKIDQAKIGALNFAKEAVIKGYSVGLIQFDTHAVLICEPLRDIKILGKYLQKMETGGNTNMSAAIRLAIAELKNKPGFRVMVIVSDGEPNNQESALNVAKQAKYHGIDIITIGTDDADEEFLKKIASRTELNIMVNRDQLAQGIASTVKMLPQYGK